MADQEKENDPRERLLSHTETLEKASQTLKEVNKTALETEETGIQTLKGLEENREVIERTQSQIPEIHGNLGRGERIMRIIKRQIITNRLMCWCCILIVVVLIGFLIYFINYSSKN